MVVPLSGFSTQRIACLLATRDELQAALPAWRPPLAVPEARMGRNPFSGEPVLFKNTRDPEPEAPAETPAFLPFEHVLLPRDEDWEKRYLALDLALSGEPGLSETTWEDNEQVFDLMFERGLMEDALFGGSYNDPAWLYEVPRRLVDRLAVLEEDALPAALVTWNARSPTAVNELSDLRDLGAVARRANALGKELFVWLIHPYHR